MGEETVTMCAFGELYYFLLYHMTLSSLISIAAHAHAFHQFLHALHQFLHAFHQFPAWRISDYKCIKQV